jgi:ABC transporter/ABC-2 type transporter
MEVLGMIAIEAVGLQKSFGMARAGRRRAEPVRALRGVDLSVPRGGVCALLGPNGAGKTTVVRVLATLIRPDAGTARVAGHDVLREPGLVRAAIGLAGQHAAVDDDLTGRENLFILGLMHHLGRGLVSFVLMALCGLGVGWRIERGAGYAVAALALLVAFQFAATWIGMYLGLVLGSEQAAGQASILLYPVTMVSNLYVPTSGMPAWLRTIADWNPISALAAAIRDLFGSPSAPANGTWQLEHPVPATLAWTAVLLAIFVPLCTRRFARA